MSAFQLEGVQILPQNYQWNTVTSLQDRAGSGWNARCTSSMSQSSEEARGAAQISTGFLQPELDVIFALVTGSFRP